ncbi:hypothetical protein Glove_144g97 [Diversispora epigaea]|uniref:Amino acid permease/ SLC12A domain-containing protein n=1 Tax=Diversispora epigaea TaxID=1348612 RepID=A0A397J0J9_9GLOM|nr:hypothetical protein Glove_144g97 [Diversispora epigaea]
MSEVNGTSGTSGGSETQILDKYDAIHIDPPSSSSSIYSRNSFNDNGREVLGVFSGMLLNVNLMIGSGIYATPGQIMVLTRSGGMTLVLYILGFFYVMLGSFIYVELGSAISESGGEQIYFEKAFPKPKKMVAYIFSVISIVLAKPFGIISVSIAASQYIYYAIHDNGYDKSALEDIHNIEFWKYRFMAFGIISFITVYHLFSNKVAVWMNQILAVIKVLTLLTVVIIGFARIKNHPERLSFNYLFSNAREIEYYNYASSMLKVLFAYSGWNTLNYSLDEMCNPKKRLRISNPASVLIVGILYCLTILALIVTVPKDYISNSSTSPEVISAKLGKEIGSELTISILIAISCFGAVGSGIWGNSRLIASVAKAGFIPIFSPVLKRFDEKWLTPLNALIFYWCYLTIIIFLPLRLVVLRKTEPELPRPFRIDLSWRDLYFLAAYSTSLRRVIEDSFSEKSSNTVSHFLGFACLISKTRRKTSIRYIAAQDERDRTGFLFLEYLDDLCELIGESIRNFIRRKSPQYLRIYGIFTPNNIS